MSFMRWKGLLAALVVMGFASSGGLRIVGQGTAAPTIDSAAPQLVIIDTDIGDDIDDAFAVALALRSPEIHLLGITTEFGDTDLRARLVDRYLQAVHRTDIPVAAGVHTRHQGVFTQAEYAREQPSHRYPDGVGFLLDQIRAHPGQITLVAIGPLFNVRAAIARDPATFRQLKRVVMMGGSIYRGYDDAKTGAQRPPEPEWNIRCDPAGLRVLLGSGVPVYMMPLDSTQIHFGPPDLDTVLGHGSALTDQLKFLFQEWSASTGRPAPTLFDPVTVAFVLHPELCPVSPLSLRVDKKGNTFPVEASAKGTSSAAAAAPNAEVCLHSDEPGFRQLLLRRIASDNQS
jgi:purine nucleosidase